MNRYHSSGPWKRAENGNPIDRRGKPVLVSGNGAGSEHAEQVANSHLIANAPDLLTALQMVMDAWTQGKTPSDCPRLARRAIQILCLASCNFKQSGLGVGNAK